MPNKNDSKFRRLLANMVTDQALAERERSNAFALLRALEQSDLIESRLRLLEDLKIQAAQTRAIAEHVMSSDARCN